MTERVRAKRQFRYYGGSKVVREVQESLALVRSQWENELDCETIFKRLSTLPADELTTIRDRAKAVLQFHSTGKKQSKKPLVTPRDQFMKLLSEEIEEGDSLVMLYGNLLMKVLSNEFTRHANDCEHRAQDTDWRKAITHVLDQYEVSDWEAKFLQSVAQYTSLSEKQVQSLKRIFDKYDVKARLPSRGYAPRYSDDD